MAIYAWICFWCEHPASEHRLTKDAPVAGPYACRRKRCDCLLMQADQLHGVTRTEYEQRYAPTSREE